MNGKKADVEKQRYWQDSRKDSGLISWSISSPVPLKRSHEGSRQQSTTIMGLFNLGQFFPRPCTIFSYLSENSTGR